MKLLPLLIGFFFCNSAYSQYEDFKLSFDSHNTIKPIIHSIDYEYFTQVKKIGFKSMPEVVQQCDNWDSLISVDEIELMRHKIRMDSVFNVLQLKYPQAFLQMNSCLSLFCTDTTFKICNQKEDNIKSETSYRFVDYQYGYLIVEHTGYEQWEFVLFNPKSRVLKLTNNLPYFANDSIVSSSGNYSGDGNFQLMQTNGNLYFGFESYDWEINECYRINKKFYLILYANLATKTESKIFRT